MSQGKLYLIPSFMGEDNTAIIPRQVTDVVYGLTEFVVENARTARRYLRAIGYTKNFDTEVIIHELDKHKPLKPQQVLINALTGKHIGLISEAGNPCIADPGYDMVSYAHQKGITVVPLVGASSILLALIASGFQGQQFSFHGYLPIVTPERMRKLKQLEESVVKYGGTQLFMETPFRNNACIKDMLQALSPTTRLSIACDLTLPTEYIHTRTIADWKLDTPDFHKRYCIFALGR
jgi:16S rRNA (cytidine1402-2'-O)-methyltransferase